MSAVDDERQIEELRKKSKLLDRLLEEAKVIRDEARRKLEEHLNRWSLMRRERRKQPR